MTSTKAPNCLHMHLYEGVAERPRHARAWYKERKVLFEYIYKTNPTDESVMQHKETCHVTLVDHTHTKK